MKQKEFAPLIILLIISILSMVLFFGYKTFFQKSNITPNWKVFESEVPSFTFEYPSNFTKEGLKDEATLLSLENDNYSLTLKKDKDISKYSPDIEDVKQRFKDDDPTVQIKSVDQYTAYVHSLQSAGGAFSFFRIITIPLESQIIEITVSPRDEDNFAGAEHLADQILSTLKFKK